MLTLPDGTEIFTEVVRGGDAGTVVIVHGLGEHSGRYGHVVAMLRDAGWSVVSYDQRGHGRSGGARGAVPHASALLEDLAQVIDFARRETSPRRLVLLGHSMGGTVAARFVAEELRPVDGLILTSPALAQDLSTAQRWKLAVFSRTTPDLAVSNELPVERLSHDPRVVEAYRSDPLVHDRVTPRLVQFILDSGEEVRAAAPRWRVPTLLLWAGSDALVAAQGSAEFAATAPPDVVRHREFPALYHEILNESEPARSEVLDEIRWWLGGP